MSTGVGLSARLGCISTDGQYLTIPMNHGITLGPVTGLVDIESTIDGITRGGVDAVLTHKGIAPRAHPNEDGKGYIVHINGPTDIGPDENDKRLTGSVEDALRVGVDAASFHINVGLDYEPDRMTQLADLCSRATDFSVPVLVMSYACGPGIDEQDPEALVHAVRLAEGVGTDVVKTAYSGDAESFGRAVEATRLSVVVAGGSRGTNREMVEMVRGTMDAGAAGVSMGRSIFQHENPEVITRAVSAVIHDGADVDTALERTGLGIEM